MTKKIITSVALILTSAIAVAQESFTVKMNMKIEGLPAEYAGFGENEMVNYFKGDKYKMEMTSMMGSSITSFDGKKMVQLNEQMGDKSGFTATKEEMDATKEKSDAKPKIEYTTDKKMIAGYECTKAILTTAGKDKKEEKMNVWVTEKIKNPQPKGGSSGRKGMGMDLGDLKGYPLEIEMSQNNQGMEMKILITTSEVSTANIDDSAFNVSTDGYKIISYKEHQEKIKAMQAKGGSH